MATDASAFGLLLKDKLQVQTKHGLCEIQLLFGDISRQPQDDPVDILVVSDSEQTGFL